jgi:hypothetical protein
MTTGRRRLFGAGATLLLLAFLGLEYLRTHEELRAHLLVEHAPNPGVQPSSAAPLKRTEEQLASLQEFYSPKSFNPANPGRYYVNVTLVALPPGIHPECERMWRTHGVRPRAGDVQSWDSLSEQGRWAALECDAHAHLFPDNYDAAGGSYAEVKERAEVAFQNVELDMSKVCAPFLRPALRPTARALNRLLCR